MAPGEEVEFFSWDNLPDLKFYPNRKQIIWLRIILLWLIAED